MYLNQLLTVLFNLVFRALLFDVEMNCLFACTDTSLIMLTNQQKQIILYTFPTPTKITRLFSFIQGNSKQLFILSTEKTYIVLVNMVNTTVTVKTSDTVVNEIYAWENGFVGWANGKIKFLDADINEIWSVKVGDARVDYNEGGQGMFISGRGSSSVFIYWKGNQWCLVSGNVIT